jgi:hypothetical protein
MSKPRTAAPAKSNRTPGGASKIAPGVFVGGWNDATAFQGVRVCVLDEVPAEPIPGATYLPIYEEGPDRVIRANLDRVADLVVEARRTGQPALLFCGHGVRRGSLAGAWYLHRAEGISLDAAYEKVRSVRPKIQHVREWVGNWTELGDEAGDPKSKSRPNRAR